MPGVDVRLDEPTRELASKDALLLAGYDGPIDGACWGDGVLARAETAEQRVKVLEARQADDLAEFGLMEVRAETAERELEREREAFQRHEQTLRDNGINSHSEAVVLVDMLRRERDMLGEVIEDTARELGCKNDNEEILIAIDKLRRERDRIADELDTMDNNHRVMAKLLADTGRERDEARAALKPMIPLAEDTAKKLRQCGSPMADQIEKLARAARAITGEKP